MAPGDAELKLRDQGRAEYVPKQVLIKPRKGYPTMPGSRCGPIRLQVEETILTHAMKRGSTRAGNADILSFAAEGNSGNEKVIAVAAIDPNAALSSFSSYGATSVDLGAPGRSIVSTVPARVRGRIVSRYSAYRGTSMATPHVAGAAALYTASNPGATAAQVKSAILNSTVAFSALSGKTLTGGRLDVSGF